MSGSFCVRYWHTLFCTALLTGITSATELRTKVSFSETELSFARERGYDLISLCRVDSYLDGPTGEPVLPGWTAHIQLPVDAQVTDIRTEALTELVLPGLFDIMPGQMSVPVGAENDQPFTRQLPKVYLSDKRYRSQLAIKGNAGKMRGHNLVSVAINPVDYIPLTGQVILTTELEIIVDYEINKSGNTIRYKQTRPDQLESVLSNTLLNEFPAETTEPLAAIAENQTVEISSISQYYSAPGNVVEYLVITTAEFVDEFEPLLTWKTQKGVPAAAILVSDIIANYGTATDTVQEKIKRCIADYAVNKGTLWVVLGADHNNIPAQGCYGCVNTSPATIESNIPTELYYSDTDDIEWDDNGDGIYGKLSNDGDTIDMYPDVFVGRISAYPGKAEHVTNAVTKIINYEKNPPADNYAKKMLMAGSRLWGDIDGVVDSQAKSEKLWNDYIEPVWTGTKYRFYSTATDFTGGSDYILNNTNLAAQINDGYNFLHIACHGNSTIWELESGYLSSSNVYSMMLNGGGPTRWDACNITTMACLTNAFDQTESALGEAFLRASGGGAVSYIGSTRYSWGFAGTALPGVSLQYNQIFYNYLFDNNHSYHIGELLAQAKMSKLGLCSSYNAYRWVQYSLALMGDPEMTLYTADPTVITASFETQLSIGQQTFTVTTDRPKTDICLTKGNEIYIRGKTDSKGDFSTTINPTSPGELVVTVTAKNYKPFQASAIVSVPQPVACQNLYAANINGAVSLTWLPSDPDNTDHYRIYRADLPDGDFELAGISDCEYFTDSLELNTSRYYFVTAIDIYGNEGLSSSISDTSYQLLPIRTTETSSYQILALEAEQYDFSVRSQARQWYPDFSHTNASGNAAMSIISNNDIYDPVVRPSLRYRVYFSEPGVYYTWVRAWTQDSADSCHIGIDGSCNTMPLTGHLTGTWSWSASPENASIEISSPGVHIVEVWPAENGCLIDKLVLSTDPAAAPTELGPQTVYAGTMDLVADGNIDLNDFASLAQNWLAPYDIPELTELVQNWGLSALP